MSNPFPVSIRFTILKSDVINIDGVAVFTSVKRFQEFDLSSYSKEVMDSLDSNEAVLSILVSVTKGRYIINDEVTIPVEKRCNQFPHFFLSVLQHHLANSNYLKYLTISDLAKRVISDVNTALQQK